MAIFKYELRQLGRYILWWSVALGFLIYAMLPTYIGFMTGTDIPIEMLSGNYFYEAIGLSMKHLSAPIGVYGFLTSFTMIAAAICGMYMGLSVITKEYTGKTTDFLITKPHSRSTVYFAKVAATVCAAIVIGAAYIAGSFASILSNGGAVSFDLTHALLIGLSLIFIEFIFISIGTLVGTLLPKIRTPLMVSSGVVFVLYICGTFSRKTNIVPVRFLSPFAYFDSAAILDTGGYNTVYFVAFAALLLLFTLVSRNIFVEKDVIPIS